MFNYSRFSRMVSEKIIKDRSYQVAANEVNLSVSTLYAIVNRTSKPALDTVIKLCKHMQVSPVEFFDSE